jgi:hypothetical protein
MSTDASKLEHVQQKFTFVCFYCFPVMFLMLILLPWRNCIIYLRGDTVLMHFSLFRSIIALSHALPFWKMLAFMFLSAMLENSRCFVLVSLISTGLLHSAHMLPMWWIKLLTYNIHITGAVSLNDLYCSFNVLCSVILITSHLNLFCFSALILFSYQYCPIFYP